MKKTITIASVVFLFVAVSFVSAKDNPEGQPFQSLWNAIENIHNKIDNISLTPGPEGSQGDIGPQGIQGEIGPQGPQGEPGSVILGIKKNIPYVSILSYPTPRIVPGTRFCFNKKNSDSLVKITYQDNIYTSGYCAINSVLDGNHLKKNEVGIDGGVGIYSSISPSWIEEASVGNHCVEIAVTSSSSARCDIGASSTRSQVNNFILVEEFQY